jgi:selenium metabolism protein YedF
LVYEIDCRNLSCPAPVIKTKQALESAPGATLRVTADMGPARENIIRFAKSKGFSVQEEENNGFAVISISPGTAPALPDSFNNSVPTSAILIASDRFGNGPDELGKLLIKNLVITLLELPVQPEKIFFINSGVLLTTEGSELIEPLTRLNDAGVEILSCGICLDYFGLREKLAVGSITNMYTIAETLMTVNNAVRI